MYPSTALTVFSLWLAATQAAKFDVLVERERLADVPAGFTSKGKVDPHTLLSFQLNLVSPNLTMLQRALEKSSDPSSSSYGAHLSESEVAALVAPSTESTGVVTQWLASYGVKDVAPVTRAGDWVWFNVDAQRAEEMFGTTFETFEHSSGYQAVRTTAYSLPSELSGHVELVHPTTNFPVILPPRSSPSPQKRAPQAGSPPDFLDTPSPERRETGAASLPSSCADNASPSCIQTLYGIPTTLAPSQSSALFVSGFQYEYASPTDLSSFLAEYRPDIASSTFTIATIDSGEIPYDPTSPGQEGDLDVQYTVGLASGVPTTFLSVGDEDFGTGLLNQATYLLGLAEIPGVLSTSYAADESSFTPSMATAICNAYMQLGARGMSIIVATGDGGVGGTYAGSCASEPFGLTFPASCPYVTAVGSTQLSSTTEVGADFTTGGFSSLFSVPSYQSSVVSSYISTQLTPSSTYAGLYNATSRAIPDVSALGVNYPITWYGVDDIVTSGTSASAPTFASIIALLNSMLVEDGKPTLGFLNPLLYSSAANEAFTDITEGDNPGCGTNGFSAATGWDPVTGLGTPIFDALMTVVGL